MTLTSGNLHHLNRLIKCSFLQHTQFWVLIFSLNCDITFYLEECFSSQNVVTPPTCRMKSDEEKLRKATGNIMRRNNQNSRENKNLEASRYLD